MLKLCLNMIVKNEAANLLRCFNSVLPAISSWEIVDTGSSDGTTDLIHGYFRSRGIPGRLHHVPFENFSQSRNAALEFARHSPHDWDYLLLTDADMELVASEDGWRTELTGAAHDVLQKQGTLSYWNVRLVRRDCDSIYYGVTHEYFGHETASHVRGIWFRDHASGGCRGDKVERDVRLLSDDLGQNPRNDRSWFYLAQSYKDLGRHQEALDAYTKRIEIGGWAEEVWYAKWMRAGCHLRLGDEGNFLKCALEAYNDRPWRAEPLYELAQYYRNAGKNHISLAFSERGMQLSYPEQDVLFVEDHVYKTGLREEFSIAGFYDHTAKEEAHRVCDELALARDGPETVRQLARSNLFHYLLPLKSYAPSLYCIKIEPPGLPEPYIAMNPSLCEWKGDLWINLRTVNYRINEAGQYVYPPDDHCIRTRNFLFMARDGHRIELRELHPMLPVSHGEVMGLEDVRIWPGEGSELWGSATVLQLHPGHPRQMVKFQIVETDPQSLDLGIAKLEELSAPNGCEKNWMPVITRPHSFVYSMDQMWHGTAKVPTAPSQFAAADFRGGGQVIPFEGGWLAIVHEAMNNQHYAQRMYVHRFVWLNTEFRLEKVSLPFVFFDRQIEFAAGLAEHQGRIVVTFGVRDREAWMATLDKAEVREMLR